MQTYTILTNNKGNTLHYQTRQINYRPNGINNSISLFHYAFAGHKWQITPTGYTKTSNLAAANHIIQEVYLLQINYTMVAWILSKETAIIEVFLLLSEHFISY